MHLRIQRDDQLVAVALGAELRLRQRDLRDLLQLRHDALTAAADHHALVDGAPERALVGQRLLVSALDELEPVRLVVAEHQIEQLDRRTPAVERRDQWLLDADHAVHAAAVAPALEVVRRRQVPARARRRLVVVEAQVNAVFDLGERAREGDVARARVGRVAAQDQQRVDRVGAGRERLERREILAGVVGHRIFDVEDGARDVAEQHVQAVHDGVHFGRLLRSGDDQRAADVADQLLDDRVEELLGLRVLEERRVGGGLRRSLLGQGLGAWADLEASR